MDPLTLRVAARYEAQLLRQAEAEVEADELEADQQVEGLVIPREYHLPPEVRGHTPITPEGTDLMIWTWDKTVQTPLKGPQQRFYGIAFAGKANKPLWNYVFGSEASRQKMIDETVHNRKGTLQRKQEEMDKRKNFQHTIQVGDIFNTSWGYDQTNVEFYQAIEIRGKDVIVREISQKEHDHQSVMPEPNHFVGAPIRVRANPSGGFKVENQYASKWDGKPEYVTPSGMGH